MRNAGPRPRASRSRPSASAPTIDERTTTSSFERQWLPASAVPRTLAGEVGQEYHCAQGKRAGSRWCTLSPLTAEGPSRRGRGAACAGQDESGCCVPVVVQASHAFIVNQSSSREMSACLCQPDRVFPPPPDAHRYAGNCHSFGGILVTRMSSPSGTSKIDLESVSPCSCTKQSQIPRPPPHDMSLPLAVPKEEIRLRGWAVFENRDAKGQRQKYGVNTAW